MSQTPEPRPVVRKMAAATRDGRMDRREFLALASVLGTSAATAYGLLGLSVPARAQETPRRGGILRVGQGVLDINDPRVYDWPEKGNVARQFLEPLVRLEADGTFTPMLLESWEVSDDARSYTLRVRRDAVWNNGDPFTTAHVIENIRRFADARMEGNSMSARMAALRDEGADQLADWAIEQLDDWTIRLNLRTPDITLIPSFADYPGLCVHPSFPEAGNLAETPIGTGPFVLTRFDVGERAEVRRRESGWWGGEVYLEGVDFIDFGTDEGTLLAAFAAGEIDMNDESSPDFDEAYLSVGLNRKAAVTTTTMVSRMNMQIEPFTDQRVRRAMQLAVDNEVVLQLGVAGQGSVAENHHAAPLHPEYAELPIVEPDPEAALAMLTEAGHADTTFELISIDDGWLKTTSDVVAAQLRDAGINVERTVLPGATFWNDWTKYPFSSTSWGARPLAVMNYALAYRTGEAWNETGHSNPEFDAKLDEALAIFDPDERRVLMADLQQMLQDSGVLIQPYWNAQIMHHVDRVRNYVRHPIREMHFEEVWLAA